MLSSHSSEPDQAIKPAQTRQRAEREFVTADREVELQREVTSAEMNIFFSKHL